MRQTEKKSESAVSCVCMPISARKSKISPLEILPKVKKEIGQIAILRLDADWYSSTMTILNELYDQVVSGGFVIFDDYGTWPGCRQAVHEFIEKRKLKVKFQYIGTNDPTAFGKLPPMYFVKP